MATVSRDRYAMAMTEGRVLPGAGDLAGVLGDAVSIELLISVIDMLPVGVAVVDVSPEFRIVHCNPMFERWTPAENLPLTGRPFGRLRGVEQNRVLDVLRETVARGEPRHFPQFEFVGYPNATVTLPGDVTVWTWDLYPIRAAGGEVTHLLSVGMDITAQVVSRTTLVAAHEEAQDRLDRLREAEMAELRLHGERARELEKVKSEFLNLAAHELRGPVTVLQGYLSMLDDGSLPRVEGRARETLPILRARCAHMNRLIDDMLDAARLEEGRLELHPELVDLGIATQVVVQTVGPLATPLHRLRVKEPDTPLFVRGDRNRIHSMLADLVENAIKYSPDGGDVECVLSADGDVASVAVRDRGLGMAEAEMSQLFTRFGRTVTRETSNIPGSGLGLYLARELARLHGGDVGVTSTPGVGSTFTLTLPLATCD